LAASAITKIRKPFDDRPLRDLLLEAIRYGDRPDVKARLYQQVDNALEWQHLRELLKAEL
jgi:hypothetical protein